MGRKKSGKLCRQKGNTVPGGQQGQRTRLGGDLSRQLQLQGSSWKGGVREDAGTDIERQSPHQRLGGCDGWRQLCMLTGEGNNIK